MQDYIKRLMNCGYSLNKAYYICVDFMRNLPLFDLQFFVESVEEKNNVDRV